MICLAFYPSILTPCECTKPHTHGGLKFPTPELREYLFCRMCHRLKLSFEERWRMDLHRQADAIYATTMMKLEELEIMTEWEFDRVEMRARWRKLDRMIAKARARELT